MIDLTDIITAVLGLIAALITYYLIPWLKERTTNQQQQYLEGMYRIAVFAAEQLLGAGQGSEKLEYAYDYLRNKGIKVDRDRIEATVREYFGHWGEDAEGKTKLPDAELKTAEETPQTGT